jgi:hypothetical protein
MGLAQAAFPTGLKFATRLTFVFGKRSRCNIRNAINY